MVFRSQIRRGQIPPDKQMTKDKDEYSIGSTFSANPHDHICENDPVTDFSYPHAKWQVVSASNKIPKKLKEDYAYPWPMRYNMTVANDMGNKVQEMH